MAGCYRSSKQRGRCAQSGEWGRILWLVFWLSLLAVLWDVFTGWHRWSLNYVVPSLCVFAMAGMAVIARVLHLRVEDFFIYLIRNESSVI